MNYPVIRICIPTLNPPIDDLIKTKMQIPTEVLGYKTEISIVDSGSRNIDEIRKIFEDVIQIDKSSFNHGATRNLIAFRSPSKILVFLTQDALVLSKNFLENLIEPIILNDAAATYGRQLPREDASLLETFSRYFNYPDHDIMKNASSIKDLGVKAFFYSNVCSAIDTEIFKDLGGFPEDVIMNEDMILAVKVISAGYNIKYVHLAEVIHSHEYSLLQQFKRNFDVGTFFADNTARLPAVSVEGEGVKFLKRQMRYVISHGKASLIPLVFLEAFAKLSGYQLGKRHRILPKSFKMYASMHSYHWNKPKE